MQNRMISAIEIIDAVKTEMQRAAALHGDRFEDYKLARAEIIEEVIEIFQAYEIGNVDHMRDECIQAIGVIIKWMRTTGVA